MLPFILYVQIVCVKESDLFTEVSVYIYICCCCCGYSVKFSYLPLFYNNCLFFVFKFTLIYNDPVQLNAVNLIIYEK